MIQYVSDNFVWRCETGDFYVVPTIKVVCLISIDNILSMKHMISELNLISYI